MRNALYILGLLLALLASGCEPLCADLSAQPPPPEMAAQASVAGFALAASGPRLIANDCGTLYFYDSDLEEEHRVKIFDGDESCVLAAAAAADDVFISGVTRTSLSGPAAGEEDVFIARYNAGGEKIWLDQFGSSAKDVPTAISLTPSGVYLAGYTLHELPGASRSGGRDAFVARYDPSGHRLWLRQFGTMLGDKALALAPAPGGVYVAGATQGSLLDGSRTIGPPRAFLARLDSEGGFVWTREWDCGDYNSVSTVSNENSVYLAYVKKNQADRPDLAVLSLHADGSPAWESRVGTASDDYLAQLAITPEGSLALLGSTFGQFPGFRNPRCLSAAFGFGGEVQYSDAFLAILSEDGLLERIIQFGGVYSDYGLALAAGGGSQYYIIYGEERLSYPFVIGEQTLARFDLSGGAAAGNTAMR